MVVRRLPEESELYHHGIMGMRWGVRRYQNKDGSLTNAGRKHRGLIEQIRYNRKMKKVRKAKVEKQKAQQKAKEEQVKRLQQANEERRQRAEVIKTGSAKDIQKFQHKMSDKEYETALRRIDLTQKLNEAVTAQSKAKSEKMAARLNTVMNTANTVANIADNVSKVYSALEKVGVIKKKDSGGEDKELKKWQREANLTLAKKQIVQNNAVIKAAKDDKKKNGNNNVDGSQIAVLTAKMDDVEKILNEMKDKY